MPMSPSAGNATSASKKTHTKPGSESFFLLILSDF
jgi:hypothetical protein